MTPDDLVEIRSRAEASPLGMQVARALDQAILDRRALLAEVDRLAAQVTAVRDLHTPHPNWPGKWCIECNRRRDLMNDDGVPYPCPTIRLLDEDPDPDPHVPYLDN